MGCEQLTQSSVEYMSNWPGEQSGHQVRLDAPKLTGQNTKVAKPSEKDCPFMAIACPHGLNPGLVARAVQEIRLLVSIPCRWDRPAPAAADTGGGKLTLPKPCAIREGRKNNQVAQLDGAQRSVGFEATHRHPFRSEGDCSIRPNHPGWAQLRRVIYHPPPCASRGPGPLREPRDLASFPDNLCWTDLTPSQAINRTESAQSRVQLFRIALCAGVVVVAESEPSDLLQHSAQGNQEENNRYIERCPGKIMSVSHNCRGNGLPCKKGRNLSRRLSVLSHATASVFSKESHKDSNYTTLVDDAGAPSAHSLTGARSVVWHKPETDSMWMDPIKSQAIDQLERRWSSQVQVAERNEPRGGHESKNLAKVGVR
ncbi:hypothetical protein RRG08_057828 [Elysia crispata]|uniref:Uncharacterized protein n=1 Tax=Elysia crispata TaxID=231223 RepID=A0AAE1E7A1_9GAST|nr:hypothetical protein RRG08_057828 [Elysia crispata]